MTTEDEQTYIQTQGSINTVTIQCRLWLDTWASKSLISYQLAPVEYHKQLPYKIVTRTVENKQIEVTHCLEPKTI